MGWIEQLLFPQLAEPGLGERDSRSWQGEGVTSLGEGANTGWEGFKSLGELAGGGMCEHHWWRDPTLVLPCGLWDKTGLGHNPYTLWYLL